MYVDAEEMQKVLETTFRARTIGSGLPGAEVGDGPSTSGSSSGGGGGGGPVDYDAATSPQDDDDVPRAPRKSRKMVQSDGSDYSGSDEE